MQASTMHLTARRVPSNEDWDRLKPQIKQLYLVENKTLKDVMEFVENEYSVKATVKMFKNRLTKWGFDQKYKRRGASDFHVNQKRRASIVENASAMHRVVPREDSSDDEPDAKRARNSSTPPTSLAARAAGKPVEQTASSDDGLAEPIAILHPVPSNEPLLREISSYFSASFGSNMWLSDGPDKQCRSTKAWKSFTPRSSKLAARLLRSFADHHLRILQVLESASEADDFVTAECPETIPDLIELSLRLINQGEYTAVSRILGPFREISAAHKIKSASVYGILAHHSTGDCLTFEKVVAQAWRFVVRQFQQYLGELHLTAVRCHVRWLRYFAETSVCDLDICSSKCEHVEYSKSVLTDLLKRCDAECSPRRALSPMVLQSQVNILLAAGRYAEAENACREIMNRTGREYRNHIFITALESLSVAQRKQRKFAQAERNLRQLVDLSADSWGRDACQTRCYVDRLNECLIQSGKEVEAVWDAPGSTIPFA